MICRSWQPDAGGGTYSQTPQALCGPEDLAHGRQALPAPALG